MLRFNRDEGDLRSLARRGHRLFFPGHCQLRQPRCRCKCARTRCEWAIVRGLYGAIVCRAGQHHRSINADERNQRRPGAVPARTAGIFSGRQSYGRRFSRREYGHISSPGMDDSKRCQLEFRNRTRRIQSHSSDATGIRFSEPARPSTFQSVSRAGTVQLCSRRIRRTGVPVWDAPRYFTTTSVSTGLPKRPPPAGAPQPLSRMRPLGLGSTPPGRGGRGQTSHAGCVSLTPLMA